MLSANLRKGYEVYILSMSVNAKLWRCTSNGHIMDEIRDPQKNDLISRFFDKQQIKTNIFGDNQSAERIYRRAERVVAAIFLITNHVSDAEPLRSEIRSEAIKMLREMTLLRDQMRVPQSAITISIRNRLRYLISAVRMLPVAGLLSIQNASAVCEALDEVGSFLNSAQNTPLSESLVLSGESIYGTHDLFLKDIKDRHKAGQSIKDKISHVSDSKIIGPIGVLDARKANILSILNTTQPLGIKDISSNFPEYSEKTIQRELAELVAQGKVTKIGLKRWSRYSLAL